MASPSIQALLDAYPSYAPAAKPFLLLQMIRYTDEMLSVNHSKSVEQGRTISKHKETVEANGQTISTSRTVEANGQTIIELKAKVAKRVGPLQPSCPPPT